MRIAAVPATSAANCSGTAGRAPTAQAGGWLAGRYAAHLLHALPDISSLAARSYSRFAQQARCAPHAFLHVSLRTRVWSRPRCRQHDMHALLRWDLFAGRKQCGATAVLHSVQPSGLHQLGAGQHLERQLHRWALERLYVHAYNWA